MPADLRIEQVPFTHADALLLIDEVQREYVVRYGGPDRTPLEPAYFDAPDGAFYVGYRDEAPVAMGGWRFRPDVTRLGSRARRRGEADVRRADGPTRWPGAG